MINRLIVNALGCLVVITLISSCSSVPKEITVSARPIKKPNLVVPKADELNLRNVKWIIITRENQKEKWEELSGSGRSLAFFATTDKGYENLGLNYSDLRAYIHQQEAIISAYESYYQESNKAFDETNADVEQRFKEQVKESDKGFFGKLLD